MLGYVTNIHLKDYIFAHNKKEYSFMVKGHT